MRRKLENRSPNMLPETLGKGVIRTLISANIRLKRGKWRVLLSVAVFLLAGADQAGMA
ncbi:MAG: hypothetical protein QW797_06925 [Thermoproteota archaeon]